MLLGGSEILTGGSEAMKAMRLVLFLLTVVTALGLEPAAHAGEYTLGQLLVQHPWARASIGQAKAGVAYLVCGGDKLVHGSGGICPAAGGVKLCHL